ncbi:MAG: hypothetical protein ACO3A4_09065, partial [Silvanigrellaceae bacterium]
GAWDKANGTEADWTAFAAAAKNSVQAGRMPPGTMSTDQKTKFIAYLDSLLASTNTTTGGTSAAFTLADAKPFCNACHIAGGSGAGAWDKANGTEADWTAFAATAKDSVQAGRMPIGTMTTDQRTKFIDYLDSLLVTATPTPIPASNNPPTATLSAPWNGGGTVTGSNTGAINFTLNDPDAGDTVSVTKVEFSSNGGTNWQNINCITLTATSCTWNAAVTNGTTYRVRLTFADSRGATDTVQSTSNVSVNLVNANGAPSVALTGIWQSGNAALTGSSTGTITYATSDPENNPLTVTVQYSSNGGSNWLPITCSNADKSTSCQWNAAIPDTIPEGDSYRVRVTVNDGTNPSVSASTVANFGITNTNYRYSSTGTVKAQTLLVNYCGSCHGLTDNAFRAGSYNSDPKDAYPMRTRISARIYDPVKPMPKSGWTTAGKPDRAKIQLWIWQGALQ